MADYQRLLKVAAGEEPADLVIKNGLLVNTVTREIYPATVGICEDTIAYVTTPEDSRCEGIQTINAEGMWITPGLIDSHMHIESTHVTPAYFSDAVVPRGVTTVAQDPHEIANVLGKEGVDYMRQASAGLALRVLTFVPTCVPAVPGLETSGAEFTAVEVDELLNDPTTIGLAEVMDYWGVIRRKPRISEIVQAGRKRGVILTGHIRGLGGRELNTYLAAGIDSDHEILKPEGILERTRLGMNVEICCTIHRDNVAELVEFWKRNGRLDNIVLVTDDTPPHNLLKEGHVDRGVRRAIALGMDPVEAIRVATLAPARRLRRPDLGNIAPGKTADILLLRSLEGFEVQCVITRGEVRALDGKIIHPAAGSTAVPERALHSVRLPRMTAEDFILTGEGRSVTAKVITQRGRGLKEMEFPLVNGKVIWEGNPDLALASIWHRHGRNHNHFSVLLEGIGLKAGALATTYAHDSHNLVVVGRSPADMAAAANLLIEAGGGYAAAAEGKKLALAALPVAGVLADCPVEELAGDFRTFMEAAASLGVAGDPISLLTSLPLPVVPAYRPTDMGLVDVERQELMETFVFHQ